MITELLPIYTQTLLNHSCIDIKEKSTEGRNRLGGQVAFALSGVSSSSSCIPRRGFRSGFLLREGGREKEREREVERLRY